MSRLEDPEFTIKDALVMTRYPGASAAEVEEEVSDALEQAVQKLGQLDEVVSKSDRGLSTLTVSIKASYDKSSLPQVWDELRRKIADAQSDLPPGAGLLTQEFSFAAMQRGYVDAITGELPVAPPSGPGVDDQFILAPWCAVSGNDVYNDYVFAWTRLDELASFLHIVEARQPGDRRFSLQAVTESGVPREQIDMALRDGVIVSA